MNRIIHEQLVKFVADMKNAQGNIRLLIENSKTEEIRLFLSDLQQMAITIGNTIEASEGEGCITVACLEDYCEAF